MISRALQGEILHNLKQFPVVALLGPRQVGKTTLALGISRGARKPSVYLDLERPSDRARLSEPELYLRSQAGRLVILDEIQRVPELFPLLRSLVDERKRGGERGGHFLILGSASPELLRQSSESLAGRIASLELRPFSLFEVAGRAPAVRRDRLWLRGGFPDSFLAPDDMASWQWRDQFISTCLERDIPQLAPRIPSEQLRRFWTMLCHQQGALLNAASLASGLGLTGKTVSTYVDLFTGLFLVRQLRPWFRNIGKRLVKAPKIYVRDSGLLHGLLHIRDLDTLLGHPQCGPSWEGFVLENLLSVMPPGWQPWHFRTAAGAEIDLILENPPEKPIAIEIKRTIQPSISKGFHLGCADIGAGERYYVMPEGTAFALDATTTAISLMELMKRLQAKG